MDTNNTSTSLAPLVIDNEHSYRLLIPEDVERKIRYNIAQCPNIEWSGYLFYDYEGSFDDPENPIVFTVKDFKVLDVGSGGATTFKDCPDVIAYMVKHDLLDYQEGLIH